MTSISVADVQDLVRQLPENQLSHAYHLLRDLAKQRGNTSVQVDFMRLPVSERKKLLHQQAMELMNHYEKTANDRLDWQSGEIRDDD